MNKISQDIRHEGMRIGGETVFTDNVIEVRYPYTDEVVGTVPAGSAEHARKAFEAFCAPPEDGGCPTLNSFRDNRCLSAQTRAPASQLPPQPSQPLSFPPETEQNQILFPSLSRNAPMGVPS